ncbi:MFS transporter [Roseovarius atlanticus]|uniref:MFS transporter n=1 Tax=Roseovarius atlanticus TaxID=1641875 RepID=A0A0T5NWL8_9RHOB|nr:c-type cytochrome [Roseovarius atlanticus]KRS13212.1 MFS transporter [Roseovarius atlanticus]
MSKFLKIFAPAAGGAAGVLTMAYVLADKFVVDIPSLAPVLVSQANAASTDAAETEPAATPTPEGGFGLGREALPEEVAAWDVDVRPGGIGLPEGRGDVATGEEVFAEACAVCHGDFAEGVGNWPVLAGGFDTLADKDPVKTVGSYWPYLSTVWDYVNRSMPFGNAQSLSPDEVYAITAYILYSNYLVEDDFELSHENFAAFEMPNADGFIIDDRPETEYPIWRTEPCMEGCKDSVQITMRASVIDVTPEEDSADEEAAAEPAAEDVAEEIEVASADLEPTEAATSEADEGAGPDPELVAAGEKVFNKCKACHMVGEGAKSRVGPVLNGVMGATIGGHDDFKYSGVFEEAAEAGRVWDEAAMAEFLAAPKSYMKGTKMSFAGLKKREDIDAIIAYLSSFGD